MSFQEQPEKNSSAPDSKGKADQANGPEIPWTSPFATFFKARRSRFRATVFAAIGAFLIVWGGLYYNNRHAPPWVAVALATAGGLFEALAVRQFLINHGKSDRCANVGLFLVALAVVCLASLDMCLEYRTGKGPMLPWIEIKTKDGLSGPMPGGEITSEMVQFFREQTLAIINSNKIDLRNFKGRLQLPEPATLVLPDAIGPRDPVSPPGVNIRFRPDPLRRTVSASGAGAKVVRNGRDWMAAEWTLEVDTLPAFERVTIPFWTVPFEVTPPEIRPIQAAQTNDLIDYLLGEYQFLSQEEWKTQVVVVAIAFDATNRVFRTSPPEGTLKRWSGYVERWGLPPPLNRTN